MSLEQTLRWTDDLLPTWIATRQTGDGPIVLIDEHTPAEAVILERGDTSEVDIRKRVRRILVKTSAAVCERAMTEPHTSVAHEYVRRADLALAGSEWPDAKAVDELNSAIHHLDADVGTSRRGASLLLDAVREAMDPTA